jgi:hypothetical protein
MRALFPHIMVHLDDNTLDIIMVIKILWSEGESQCSVKRNEIRGVIKNQAVTSIECRESVVVRQWVVPTPANTFLSRIDTLPIYSWSSSREGATAAIIIITITIITSRRPHHYHMATLSREEFSSISLFTTSIYKRNQSSLLHVVRALPAAAIISKLYIFNLHCRSRQPLLLITLLLSSYNCIQFE